jgi:hypothetical protein
MPTNDQQSILKYIKTEGGTVQEPAIFQWAMKNGIRNYKLILTDLVEQGLVEKRGSGYRVI